MSDRLLPLDAWTLAAVEQAMSAHVGGQWTARSFTDLADRSSHQAVICHGPTMSVFVKVSTAQDAVVQFAAELDGLRLLRERAAVATAVPVGPGVLALDPGALLLLEAVPEHAPEARTVDDWRSIGSTLARLHQAHGQQFGLADFDGFFGPLPQNNAPLAGSATWCDFYAERRVLPGLRMARDAGHVSSELAARVERLAGRLPQVAGPEPRPALLHGDAQQNNFISSAAGAVLIDAAPYYGHPELDLALLDYFQPVPDDVYAGYREVGTIDPGFSERRELWRIAAYLHVLAVDGTTTFGRTFSRRLADAVQRYT